MIHVPQRIVVVLENFWHFSKLNIKYPLSELVQVGKNFLKYIYIYIYIYIYVCVCVCARARAHVDMYI
jgi:hypothetical protein